MKTYTTSILNPDRILILPFVTSFFLVHCLSLEKKKKKKEKSNLVRICNSLFSGVRFSQLVFQQHRHIAHCTVRLVNQTRNVLQPWTWEWSVVNSLNMSQTKYVYQITNVVYRGGRITFDQLGLIYKFTVNICVNVYVYEKVKNHLYQTT